MAQSYTRTRETSHRWGEIQKLGLLPDVTSVLEYERRISIGTILAHDYLSEFSPNCFLIDAAETVHRIMFEEVYPWAGEFRGSAQSVIIGGYPGADSWRIVRELQLLEIQSDLFSNETSKLSLSPSEIHALLCAFHHIRFERIHPFRDGNGRVGRLLLAAAIRQFRQTEIAFAWSNLRDRYFAGLREGNKGNIAPLANMILEVCGESPAIREVKSPFRVAPRMFETVMLTDIEEDLGWSTVRNP